MHEFICMYLCSRSLELTHTHTHIEAWW